MKTNKRDFFSEFEFKTSRSSGKGGQHVNKTESRISLFFDIIKSNFLNPDEKERLLASQLFNISSAGVIQIDCEASRSQQTNKKIAIERFYQLLSKALKKEKLRKPTKPTKAAINKRIKAKKVQSEKKIRRRKDF